MRDPETIAAVASGWAPSPCAIIRLSGPGVPRILRQMFHGADLLAHRIGRARFILAESPRRLELPCLVMTFVGPRSFTGEHAAEMIVPGNPVLLERILARLCSLEGVREATPGEYAARAYLNGKLTLDQAEGVAALVAAQSQAQREAANRLLEGKTGAQYRCWADELATMLALVEAGVDFTDQEDVIPIAPDALAARLRSLIEEVNARLGARRGVELENAMPRVVLAGAPNAGKSTLFNALLGRRRAVTSEIAGTTRDVIAEPLDLSSHAMNGGRVILVDMAGLDDVASRRTGVGAQIDGAAQARAREAIGSAAVIVHCDPSGRFASPIGAGSGAQIVRVRTKADLPHESGAPDRSDVPVCALDRWNLDVLRRAIADAAWGVAAGDTFILPRHRRALCAAADALSEAHAMVDRDLDTGSLGAPELIAGSMRAALDSLGELVGQITPDEVIGRVFATFCVGK